jgi:hypothetical protein
MVTVSDIIELKERREELLRELNNVDAKIGNLQASNSLETERELRAAATRDLYEFLDGYTPSEMADLLRGYHSLRKLRDISTRAYREGPITGLCLALGRIVYEKDREFVNDIIDCVATELGDLDDDVQWQLLLDITYSLVGTLRDFGKIS